MFSSRVVGKLKRIAGRDAVLDRREDLMLYEYDGSLARGEPKYVVFPQTAQQVSEIVKLARRERLPIVPRGAGTGLSGGSIARQGGIVLAFARMNRILEIDIANPQPPDLAMPESQSADQRDHGIACVLPQRKITGCRQLARLGKNGRTFTLMKFRSMRVDAEKDGPVWAKTDDERMTRPGRLIRKIRVDEIPQFWNILRGDMNFIGPRPERPHFVAQLAEEIPYYEQRHLVAPGLTGWAQIKYPYGASIEDAKKKLEYDLYYIKNQSLSLDAAIMFETIKTILFGRGT